MKAFRIRLDNAIGREGHGPDSKDYGFMHVRFANDEVS